jgi:hypothetical protein
VSDTRSSVVKEANALSTPKGAFSLRLSRAFLVLWFMCGLLAVGCTDDARSEASISGWGVFGAGAVKLELPASFVGGDPGDPNVMAALKEVAEGNPVPEVREGLHSYLDSIDLDIELRKKQGGVTDAPLMVIWGTPDTKGQMPEVMVRRLYLGGVPGARDSSMTSLVRTLMAGYAENEWSLDSIAEDRAYVTSWHTPDSSADTAAWEQRVMAVSGGYLYEFWFSYRGDASAEIKDVFAESAESATVN